MTLLLNPLPQDEDFVDAVASPYIGGFAKAKLKYFSFEVSQIQNYYFLAKFA